MAQDEVLVEIFSTDWRKRASNFKSISPTMGKKNRTRGPNFTKEDNLLLLDTISRFKHIIGNIKTDKESVKIKNKAWEEVATIYNSSTTNSQRSVESLLSNYKNLKKKLQKPSSDTETTIQKWDVVCKIEESNSSSDAWSDNSDNEAASIEACLDVLTDVKKEAYSNDVLNKKTVDADSHESLCEVIDYESYLTNNRPSLKRKSDPLLIHDSKGPKKSTSDAPRKHEVSSSFVNLANEKLELVTIQKELLQVQLIEEKEKNEHNRLLRAMEMEDAKKRFEHNEIIRKLELQKYNN